MIQTPKGTPRPVERRLSMAGLLAHGSSPCADLPGFCPVVLSMALGYPLTVAGAATALAPSGSSAPCSTINPLDFIRRGTIAGKYNNHSTLRSIRSVQVRYPRRDRFSPGNAEAVILSWPAGAGRDARAGRSGR